MHVARSGLCSYVSHVKAVGAERSPIEEQVPVRLHAMQHHVNGDQDKLALDVLVCNRPAEALRRFQRRGRGREAIEGEL